MLPALILTFSCKEMKLDIEELKDRLDVLEGTTIISINQQISAINTSISDLKDMDKALDSYIKTLEATATDLQKQIDEANAEISKVESELGEEITAIEQSLLNELNTAKEAIKTELTAINKTLDELKAKGEALDKKISDLQTYVDTELSSTKDWANTTFSTLTQYEQTQTEISTIKAHIEQINAGMIAMETRMTGKIANDIKTAIDALRSELSTDYITKIDSAVNTVTQAYTTAISSARSEITAAYTTAIATAISESEANLKAWINKQLVNGYYDIATIDGKLSALSTRLDETDSELQKQITEQKITLEASKKELTTAYENAIKEAIEGNNGVISAAIATAVKEVEDMLKEQMEAISLKIAAISDSLADLEDAFVNRIQSIKFIPEFSDRKVKFSGISGAVLDFMIAPEEQAEALTEAWNADKNIIKAYLRYTSAPSSRAVCEPIELAVVSVTSNGKGDISVLVKENPDTPLSSDFWNDKQDALVYLRISDGANDIISELIDVVGHMMPAMLLSENGTANCYIVSKSGSYGFKAVKGTSRESAGAVASTEVLWESFGTDETPNASDLIKSTSYQDGYIVFQTADTFKEGNAVIAAKDVANKIIWSWHIWLTDEPQEQIYYNNAGIMMDRNIGATSATPGDVGALGLLYQWGRKDPFLGSSSISSNTLAKSTGTWPTIVSSDALNGTIEYATANPTAFITRNDSNNDWYYTGDTTTDNTRWTTSELSKSIYDPCPAGWRVPEGGSNGVWSKALGSPSSFTDNSLYDSTNEGINFSGKFGETPTIWYPASGMRYSGDSSLKNVGYSVGYWSVSPQDGNAHRFHYFCDGIVNPSNSNCRATGYAIRCVKE